jgi:hypothetical protein
MPGPVRGVDMARPHHFSWQAGVPIGGGNTDEVASTDRKIRDALAETRRPETKAQKTDDDDGVDVGVDAIEEHQFCPAIHLTGTLGDPKNSYGDFQNRNREKSHRTSGPPPVRSETGFVIMLGKFRSRNGRLRQRRNRKFLGDDQQGCFLKKRTDSII